jgi:hypothetical protein
MGLLEDAIREHLELKRLRGADPAEVAREQHEALEHPLGVEAVARGEGQPAVAEATADPAEAPSGGAPESETGPSADVGDLSSVGQETAELDMQAVLDGEDHSPVDEDAAEGPPAVDSDGLAPAAPVDEDSLEWEIPAASSRDRESDSPDSQPEDEDDQRPGASDHEPSTEELRGGHADDQQQAPGQGRLSF